MNRREVLQEILEKILGSRNVYYQPPESIKIKYPAIVYSRDSMDNTYANNLSYKRFNKYKLTLIDIDPESIFVDEIMKFPMCSFDRQYAFENLNHYTFELYF